MAHKVFPPYKNRNAPKTDDLFELLQQKANLLDRRLKDPAWRLSAKEIREPKVSQVNRLLCALGLEKNHCIENRGETYKGLYAWAKPIEKGFRVEYIGISQNLGKRLRGHVSSNNRSIASWVYMMAKDEFYKSEGLSEGSSKEVKDAAYKKFQEKSETIGGSYDFYRREKIQERLVNEGYFCTVVLIENDYELYMLEPYCSLKFESHWNVFQTH